MKKEYITIPVLCIIVVSLMGYMFLIQEDYEPAFDLCVETYENSILQNTDFFHQLNDMDFNSSQIIQDINNSNIRQQFLDKVAEK